MAVVDFYALLYTVYAQFFNVVPVIAFYVAVSLVTLFVYQNHLAIFTMFNMFGKKRASLCENVC